MPKPIFTLENFQPKQQGRNYDPSTDNDSGERPVIPSKNDTIESDRGQNKNLLRINKFINIVTSKRAAAVCLLAIVILIASVGTRFFSKNLVHDYPEQYSNSKNTLLVEEIEISEEMMVISPGNPVPLPTIEIRPDEARGVYLICNSSNENIVSAIDGGMVRAWDSINPEASNASVIVTVTPLYRTSRNVYDEICIIVDYTAEKGPKDSMPNSESVRYP